MRSGRNLRMVSSVGSARQLREMPTPNDEAGTKGTDMEFMDKQATLEETSAV